MRECNSLSRVKNLSKFGFRGGEPWTSVSIKNIVPCISSTPEDNYSILSIRRLLISLGWKCYCVDWVRLGWVESIIVAADVGPEIEDVKIKRTFISIFL